jgi:hypothetical protein
VRPFATLIVPFRADETLRHPSLGIASAAVVVLLVATAAAAGRREQTARGMAALVFVLGSVAPVLAYFYVDPDLLGSRYVYLAVAGWALLLVSNASALTTRTTVALVPLVCLTLFWVLATRSHIALWQHAADVRQRILSAAGSASDGACAGWIVAGVPATVGGVPLFVNGFPEAARATLGEPIQMAPATPASGQCHLTWSGSGFTRE